MQGIPIYWPAVPGWVDFVAQQPHGFKRVQVKTTATGDASLRIRDLTPTNDLAPADKYDILAVVNKHRLWLIPAPVLGTRNNLTLHPHDPDCQFNGFRVI